MSTVKLEDWSRWFPEGREVPPNTFEIALVLAGAVSAGAYTAGVIDTLVEALDAWEAAKKSGDPDIPKHDVIIRVITGASAGGMVGGIASVALRYGFPPVKPHTPHGDEERRNLENPLYRSWVKDVDISKLLATGDLDDDGHIPSLLDCGTLDEIADRASTFTGPPRQSRSWLPKSLPLLLSVTNLRGVPFNLDQRGGGGLAHGMRLHRDHMAFMVDGVGDAPCALPADCPGYVRLTGDGDLSKPEWRTFAASALATGAFPMALRARVLERWSTDYDTRFPDAARINLADDTVTPLAPFPQPKKVFSFLAVDGGAMDNEPFDLARSILAGVEGRIETSGARADRTILMIDPFAEAGGDGPSATDAPLPSILNALFGATITQARFKSSELGRAISEDDYSRFLISPARNGVRGSAAIVSGGLGAFLGFFAEPYRHHDYLLGRQNGRDFLRRWFTLPAENPLFAASGWTEAARRRFAADPDSPANLQIIPMVLEQEYEWMVPEWPRGGYSFAENDATDQLIVGRVDALYAAFKRGMRRRAKTGSLWQRAKTRAGVELLLTWVGIAWNGYLRSRILSEVRARIADAVKKVDEREMPSV